MTTSTAHSAFSHFSTFSFLWFAFVLRGQWLPYKDLSVHCSLLHANLCRPVYAIITERGVVWTAARKERKHQSTLSEGILLISVSIFKLCPVFPLSFARYTEGTVHFCLRHDIRGSRKQKQVTNPRARSSWACLRAGLSQAGFYCKSQLSNWLTETARTRKDLA